jgi:GntR family transcriptional regulator, transcriptional repressor for pyruvate dehydrogenase complex
MNEPGTEVLPSQQETGFAPLGRSSAVPSQAIEMIKQMIISGELKAGQRLPAERDLATLLGVSRPSLREAIRALTALNIVDSRHGDGTFVSSLDPELLSKPVDFLLQVNNESLTALFEARRALESAIAALAAERATALELAELEAFVKHGRSIIDDVDAFIQHDIDFHARLRRIARSPILASLLSSVDALSAESRRQTAQSPRTRALAHRDHQRLVRAFKVRDPHRAQTVMVEHLEHVRKGLPV